LRERDLRDRESHDSRSGGADKTPACHLRIFKAPFNHTRVLQNGRIDNKRPSTIVPPATGTLL
jgi:hypothetical protein